MQIVPQEIRRPEAVPMPSGDPCPSCGGTGHTRSKLLRSCHKCGGSGRVLEIGYLKPVVMAAIQNLHAVCPNDTAFSPDDIDAFCIHAYPWHSTMWTLWTLERMGQEGLLNTHAVTVPLIWEHEDDPRTGTQTWYSLPSATQARRAA